MKIVAIKLLWIGLLLAMLCACQPLINGLGSGEGATGKSVSQSVSILAPESTGENSEPVDTTCAYFYFLWGRHAELSHHFDEALEAYEKALICDPHAEYIMRKLPMLLIRLDKNEEAVDWLKKFIAAHPEETGNRLLLAKVYARLEKYDQAAQQYRAVLAQNPEDETATLLLGELHARRKQYDKAEEVVRSLLDTKDDWYAGHLFLARINVNQEQYEKALEEYRKALELNWSAGLMYEMGELLRKLDRPQEAVELYRRILKKDESAEKARIAIVHTYLGMGRDDLALKELEKLREITEHPERIDLIVARIYAHKKQYDKAISILKHLVQEEDSSEARYLLAMIHVDQDELGAALEQLEQIGEGAEEYGESVLLRVKILRKLERGDEAVALLEKILATDEEASPDLYIVLAGLYLSRGEGDKGKTLLQKALKLYPEDTELLYEYALFLDQKGETDQALEVMKEVIKADPHHSGALNYVGYTWADQGENLEQALEYIQRAVDLKPKNAYIRDSLGWVYFRMGKIKQARKELIRALELAGTDPHIHDHLGDVYRALGQRKKAIKEYERALELFGDHKDRPATEKKLKALQGEKSKERDAQ